MTRIHMFNDTLNTVGPLQFLINFANSLLISTKKKKPAGIFIGIELINNRTNKVQECSKYEN